MAEKIIDYEEKLKNINYIKVFYENQQKTFCTVTGLKKENCNGKMIVNDVMIPWKFVKGYEQTVQRKGNNQSAREIKKYDRTIKNHLHECNMALDYYIKTDQMYKARQLYESIPASLSGNIIASTVYAYIDMLIANQHYHSAAYLAYGLLNRKVESFCEKNRDKINKQLRTANELAKKKDAASTLKIELQESSSSVEVPSNQQEVSILEEHVPADTKQQSNTPKEKVALAIDKIQKYGMVHDTSREYSRMIYSMKQNDIKIQVHDYVNLVKAIIESKKVERMCDLFEAIAVVGFLDLKEDEFDLCFSYSFKGLNYIKEYGNVNRRNTIFCSFIKILLIQYRLYFNKNKCEKKREIELLFYEEWAQHIGEVEVAQKISTLKQGSALESTIVRGYNTKRLFGKMLGAVGVKRENDSTSQEIEKIHTALNALLQGEAIISRQMQKVSVMQDSYQEEIRENFSAHQHKLDKADDNLRSIQHDVEEMNAQLQEVLSCVTTLSGNVIHIKENNLYSTEEKVEQIEKAIDKQVSSLSYDVEVYKKQVIDWLGEANYNKLQPKSQKYLVCAEFLYEHLKKLDDQEMSPFVSEYCRALEFELKSNIFIPFVKNIKKDVHYRKKYDEFTGGGYKKTKRFADAIRKEEFHIELGTMSYVLVLLEQGENSSLLLDDLKVFVEKRYKAELFNTEYLGSMVSTIARDYRNAAAHTELISIELANQAKEFIRTAIRKHCELRKK